LTNSSALVSSTLGLRHPLTHSLPYPSDHGDPEA